MPAASVAATGADVHERRLLSISANVRRNNPVAASNAPSGSSGRAAGSRDSRTPASVSTPQATPIGTLTQNTADQPKAGISRPPTTGPSAKPNPPIAAHRPIAPVRRSAG